MTAAASVCAMARAARALRLSAKAESPEAIAPALVETPLKAIGPDDVLVEVRAAAVNPSDVKAAIGMMPYAVFPRTPGRDFAGIVIEGPSAWIGKQIFGSSGDLGIRRDGTHASHLVVEAGALVEKPTGVSLAEAAGIGVPFVTAQEGFRRAGMPNAGETVVILGLNGKVGQAAAQIAAWRGARVIGVNRKPEDFAGPRNLAVEVISSADGDAAERVRAMTNGRGADIVYNTVGEPFFETGVKALSVAGRKIIISSFKQPVAFDLFAFYRARHTFVGIDTLAFSSVATGEILRDLSPGFESGALKPFPIEERAIYPIERAKEAYLAVMGSSRDRIVFLPNG